MGNSKVENIEILEKIIVGRVEPTIYAFTTNTIPNYLKIGDTFRAVSKRLNEWKVFFPELVKQYEKKAVIDENIYFRDYSIHNFLENDLNKLRLLPSDLSLGIYYSREFFKDTTPKEIDIAIEDIVKNYQKKTNKYEYYSLEDKTSKIFHYERGENWELRPNQKDAVEKFKKAVSEGRKNLLMYAVMRFGKSFTSLCCAVEIKAKLVLIVSAKADVKAEWKKTVESAGNFKEYIFLESSDLEKEEKIIEKKLSEKNIVLFLTLQDLQGDKIKEKHKDIFNKKIDLLIVDETHFGARAESFGKVLKDKGYDKTDEKNINKLEDENVDINIANEELKKIDTKIRLHLSGTPYRILMGSEFEQEDIISFVQFSDIIREQEEWDRNNLNKDDINEWDNPYYGFPQMIRFAFNPNKTSRLKMEALKKSGVTFAFSKLFEPQSIKKDNINKGHKKFKNEEEIIDLLQVIDGSKEDEELLGFLDYDKIKQGKMCRHMVMVLPYCASCDAMEELIKNNVDKFKNINEYEIINISGIDPIKNYKKPEDIKNKIKQCDLENKKTLTLTVNKMLTGSTVEQWDTMLYFKDTSSPQEYDQAIFRLQNQHIRILSNSKEIIKENLKPQTILVDFDPNRLFRMQEQKALIYNVNVDQNGNNKLRERITEELRISPVIVMNHNKIREINATNILEIISEYNKNRSVIDEVLDLPVDLSLLKDPEVKKIIENQAEFNSKKGLVVPLNQDQDKGDELDLEDPKSPGNTNKDSSKKTSTHGSEENNASLEDEIKSLENKIKTYYQRILFFSFLTNDEVMSLDDILKVIDKEDNKRICKNLSLEKNILQRVVEYMNPFKRSKLDYKIQNISRLSKDNSIPPLERALISIKKFNRMSESEIITPVKVCDEMVNLLSQDKIKEIINKKEKFLDMATKSGEYIVALYKKLNLELGYSHEEIKDILYSIPTSSIAYEFTRKFYQILNLNTENISEKFNAYDLIKIKLANGDIDYQKIKKILEQNKKFNEITLEDNIVQKGDEEMKFGAIVGNPPYQVSAQGTSSSDDPVYHLFMDISYKLGERVVLITPARFLFNAGKTPKEWNKKMLEDIHLKVVVYESDSKKIFPDISIPGGLVITYRDEKEEFGKIGRFISYPELAIIKNKVWKKANESIKKIIYTQNKFELDELYKDYPEYERIIGNNGKDKRFRQIIMERLNVFTIEKNEESNLRILGLIGKERSYRFISRKYVKNEEWIDKFKVFVPFSNGASGTLGNEPARIISKPVIGYPGDGMTQTFLGFGALSNQNESEALLKYIKTKFCRILLAILKVTQGNKAETWEYVPLQNFTQESDIDWNQSIENIDLQLYKKYNLSEEDIKFINSKIAEI